MKTDVITVSSQGYQIEKALRQAEKAAEYKGLSAKNALQLRLLAEEMMGMVRSITGETEGTFWIEDNAGTYELHFKVDAHMDPHMKEQLLAASSSGRNEAKRSFMDRIRGFFSAGDDGLGMGATPLLLPEMFEDSSTPTLDWEWSMSRYQDALSARVEQDDAAARDAWDELEKSVVAHVADDVKVAIRGGSVEMTIIKRFA